MSFKRYFIPGVTLLALLIFCYLFIKIVVYVVIALVLTLIGTPVKQFISKLKIGKSRMGDTLSAIITLLLFVSFFTLIGAIFLPPIVKEVSFLSQLNFYDVLNDIFKQNPRLHQALLSFGSDQQIKQTINTELSEFINFKNISYILNNVISYLGLIAGGVFSVLFMSFFFLKDEKIVVKFLLLITPTEWESEAFEIIRTSKKMLGKYFIGLFLDVLLVSFSVTLLMWLFGIKNALVIGCLAGVMNVIPYIGPIITLCFALFLGTAGCIEFNQYELIGATMMKIVLILLSINLTDAMLVQPAIFSNTVKAHPLEIFIVILMAGILGGIVGMIVAIPTYTLIRIVAKETLVKFKFFQKLTKNIPD